MHINKYMHEEDSNIVIFNTCTPHVVIAKRCQPPQQKTLSFNVLSLTEESQYESHLDAVRSKVPTTIQTPLLLHSYHPHWVTETVANNLDPFFLSCVLYFLDDVQIPP